MSLPAYYGPGPKPAPFVPAPDDIKDHPRNNNGIFPVQESDTPKEIMLKAFVNGNQSADNTGFKEDKVNPHAWGNKVRSSAFFDEFSPAAAQATSKKICDICNIM